MAALTKLIECPRDAWQGLPDLIPTEYKAEYLKATYSGRIQAH